jgi:hypothetical protein
MTRVKYINAINGGHWFSEATMRFFHSRNSRDAIVVRSPNGPVYWWVSSETDFDGKNRRYTIRSMTADGEVSTRSKHREFANARTALKQLTRMCHFAS